MKVVMNKKALVSLAALAMLSLVGCGNKAVAPLPAPPPTTNGGYSGGGGSCGAVTGQNGSYYTQLFNVTQQQQQSIPAGMNLTFTSQGTSYIGPQPGQQVSVSGCFNWADLPLYFAGMGQGFGTQQPQINTAVPLQAQSPVYVQSSQQYAEIRGVTLIGQSSMPVWGAASQSTQVTLSIPSIVLLYGGRMLIQQPFQVFVNGRAQMPTGAQAPAYASPQQPY